MFNSIHMYTESTGTLRHPPGPARRAIRALGTLVGPHGFDRYVELVAPTWSSQEVRARVVAVRRMTPDTVTLTLAPNGRWNGFVPGQYTLLGVEIDGVRHTRCYSMANAPHPRHREIELSIKAHPEGVVSGFLVRHARPGLVVALSTARGSFTLPEVEPERLLLLSGGSGITPVMSMLRARVERGWTCPTTFAHYALRPETQQYREELASLTTQPGVRVVRIFTEAPGAGELDGFLSEAQLEAIDPEWRQAQAFVCGPASLMEAAHSLFAQAGRADNLYREAFTLGDVVAEAGTIGGELRLTRRGTARQNDGRTLLAQVESEGVFPETGCRMGICHTCTTRLCAGLVQDVKTGEMTEGPDVDIRICVSVPVGDVDLDL
jgi:ferredoxin-NADP reductase